MYIRQVSVFLENKKGRLAELTRLLTAEGINLRALSLADMADFGVLRLIVDDCARCLQVLKAHDFVAQETNVIAVEIEDRPGGLHRILEILDQEDINLEYIYAFIERTHPNAIMVVKIDDADRAVAMLQKHGIAILTEEAVRKI